MYGGESVLQALVPLRDTRVSAICVCACGWVERTLLLALSVKFISVRTGSKAFLDARGDREDKSLVTWLSSAVSRLVLWPYSMSAKMISM